MCGVKEGSGMTALIIEDIFRGGDEQTAVVLAEGCKFAPPDNTILYLQDNDLSRLSADQLGATLRVIKPQFRTLGLSLIHI